MDLDFDVEGGEGELKIVLKREIMKNNLYLFYKEENEILNWTFFFYFQR